MLNELWALATVAVLVWLGLRALRFQKHIVALRDIKPSLGPWPKISFIVAACNEEKTLCQAADSLLQINYPNLEIILINDRSRDNTGAVIDALAEENAQIKAVHITHLPKGWLGKVHALHCGIESTDSEWVLFADADIHFSINALKKAITYCQQNKIDFLSSMAEVRSQSPFLLTLIGQLFQQASLFIDPDRLNDPRHRTCFGMGAFMLFRRAVYNRSAKMQWLRMEAVDDGGLALMMRRAGARMGALAGIDEIHLEWYPSVSAYIKGVEKNAFAFCQYNWGYLIGLTVVNWLFVLGLTWAPLHCGPITQLLMTTALIFYFSSAYIQLNKMLRLPFYLVLFFPLATAILPFIYIRAAFLASSRGGISWRGTFYSLEDLKQNQRLKLGELVFTADKEAMPTFVETEPLKYVPPYRIANDPAIDRRVGNQRENDRDIFHVQ